MQDRPPFTPPGFCVVNSAKIPMASGRSVHDQHSGKVFRQEILKMIHLFISSYHNDTSWIRMPEAAVIEVGMAGRPENLAGTYSGKPGKYRKFRGGSLPRQDNKSIRNVLFDDRGDNISEENPYYGELTGLYWLWKHLDYPDSEIIGFCHYNKMLDISPGRVERLLRGISADWIAAVPDTIVPHSFPEDIRVLIRVLSEMEDQRYIDAWNRLYTGEGASAFRKGGSYAQLFYTTMREFRQYCSFLFQTLGEVRGIIGDVDRPPYHRRYCAFLGERLLSVYLEAAGSRVKYAEIRRKGGWLLLWADRTTGFLKLHTGVGALRGVTKRVRKICGLNRLSSWSRNER